MLKAATRKRRARNPIAVQSQPLEARTLLTGPCDVDSSPVVEMDLPPEGFSGMDTSPLGGGGGVWTEGSWTGEPEPLADFSKLIDLIESTVPPPDLTVESSLSTFPANLSLVVSQTQDVHQKISDLLEQLRRLQDLQITVEVRFITVRDDFFERIGVDFDLDIQDPDPTAPPTSTDPLFQAPFHLDPTAG